MEWLVLSSVIWWLVEYQPLNQVTQIKQPAYLQQSDKKTPVQSKIGTDYARESLKNPSGGFHYKP